QEQREHRAEEHPGAEPERGLDEAGAQADDGDDQPLQAESRSLLPTCMTEPGEEVSSVSCQSEAPGCGLQEARRRPCHGGPLLRVQAAGPLRVTGAERRVSSSGRAVRAWADE